VRAASLDVIAEATVGDVTPPSLGFLEFALNLLPAPKSRIESIAIAGSGAGGGAAGASVSLNEIANVIDAHVAGNADVETSGQIAVTADNDSSIWALSGGVAGAGGAAAGVSVADNKIGGTTTAFVSGTNTTVESTGGGVTLAATAGNRIELLALGGAGAGGFATGGSIAKNVITSAVDAHASGGAEVIAPGAIAIGATDTSTIDVLSGGLAGAGGLAAGIAYGTNEIGGTVTAYVDGTGTDVDSTGSTVTVEATADSTIAALSSAIGIFSALLLSIS
jgi:hypothetical protein